MIWSDCVQNAALYAAVRSAVRSLEPALRNDHDVARAHVDVRRYVAALDQILKANAVRLAAFGRARNRRVIAVGELGQAAHRDHHVEYRHVLPVRQDLRLGGLADHADLLAARSDKIGHDDGDDRVADVLGQRLFDIARESRRRLALRRQVVDQRRGDLSVRTHRYGERQLGVAPYDDVDGVQRADHVVVVSPGGSAGRRRVGRPHRAPGGDKRGGDQAGQTDSTLDRRLPAESEASQIYLHTGSPSSATQSIITSGL